MLKYGIIVRYGPKKVYSNVIQCIYFTDWASLGCCHPIIKRNYMKLYGMWYDLILYTGSLLQYKCCLLEVFLPIRPEWSPVVPLCSSGSKLNPQLKKRCFGFMVTYCRQSFTFVFWQTELVLLAGAIHICAQQELSWALTTTSLQIQNEIWGSYLMPGWALEENKGNLRKYSWPYCDFT